MDGGREREQVLGGPGSMDEWLRLLKETEKSLPELTLQIQKP